MPWVSMPTGQPLPVLFTEHEVRRPRPIDKSRIAPEDLFHWILKEIRLVPLAPLPEIRLAEV